MISHRPQPVFIIGIANRSGTNHLYSLLLQHEAFARSAVQGEDFLLSQSNCLLGYVDKVAARWNPVWGNDPDGLTRSLETGLMAFLTPPDVNAPKILSKTPVPENAIHFFRLFSQGQMILLIRNGQDLSESYVRSFRQRFEFAVRRWVDGASEICKIIQAADARRVILLRYEDLCHDPERELRKLSAFLEIDPEKFDYDKVRRADVIGSSDLIRQSGNLNWQPVKKPKDFNPIGRASGWSRWRHYRFNWIAGDYCRRLDYEMKYAEKGMTYLTYNVCASAYYYLHHLVLSVVHALRVARHGARAMKWAFLQKF